MRNKGNYLDVQDNQTLSLLEINKIHQEILDFAARNSVHLG